MTQPREITERYQLEKILRSSRTGSVLRATDSTSGQTVVVKMITMGVPTPEGMARFERLAEALGESPHASFPAVHDAGFSPDGSAFLVLENLEGRGFESLAGGRGHRVLSLVDQILEGLEVLAGRGLFHGNLSPDNLLVIRPQADGVKIFGFGTALFRTPEAAGADAQNARFRAPEELDPAALLPDAARWRSDLHSLALTACRVLGAEVSFADTPTPKVAIPTVLGFELKEPDALRTMLEGALRRKPEDRPTLAQARTGLRRALGLSAAPPLPVPAKKPVARPAPPPVAVAANLDDTNPIFPLEASGPPAAPPAAVKAPPPAAPPAPLAAGLVATDLPPLPPSSPVSAASPLASVPVVAPVPAIPPAAAPPPAAAEEPEGALLSFDDDLLGDLPPVPPVPPAGPAGRPAPRGAAPVSRTGPVAVAAPAAAGTTPGTAATPAGAPAEPLSWRDRFLKPVPLAAAGGGLLLLLVGLGWLLFFGRSAPPPPRVVAAPPRPAVPAPPPLPPPATRLATAQGYATQGQEHEALVALKTLTPAEVGTLAPPDAQTYRTLQDTLAKNMPVRVPNDLATGWKTKDLSLLHGAVEDAALLPAGALLPSAQGDLARARQVTEIYDRAAAADHQSQAVEVLERFGEIGKLLPGVRDGSGLRDRAAAKLETESDALVRDAHYDEAVAHLEPLSRTWADRPGLKARLADVRAQEKAELAVAAAITEASAAEKLKKPDQGLAALRKVKTTAHLEASYNDVKQRLETLLAQYDNNPPTVELRDGYLLDYDRGTPVNLSFRVRDDYKVESVKIYARPSGGRMAEMPYTKDGFSYTVAISPSFHQNQTVEFYVVATDPSGHETYLGTRDKPMQLKRKKGFREQ